MMTRGKWPTSSRPFRGGGRSSGRASSEAPPGVSVISKLEGLDIVELGHHVDEAFWGVVDVDTRQTTEEADQRRRQGFMRPRCAEKGRVLPQELK